MCIYVSIFRFSDGLKIVMSSGGEARKTLDFGIDLSARPRDGDTLLMMILYE